MSTGLAILTGIHVLISLVAIGSGFVVTLGMLTSMRLNGWTALFLTTTVATSVTGFFFPFEGFTPAIGTGIVSMLALPVAITARYRHGMIGSWRWIYIVSAMLSHYLNVFVLVVQAFLKVPTLHAIAPQQSNPPFIAVQTVVLIGFVALAVAALKRFRITASLPVKSPADLSAPLF